MLFCRCRRRRPFYCLRFSVLHFLRPVVVFVVKCCRSCQSCLVVVVLVVDVLAKNLVSYGSERAAGVYIEPDLLSPLISRRTYRLANARGTLARYAIAFAKLYQIRKFVIVSFGSLKENKTPLERVNQSHPSHKA